MVDGPGITFENYWQTEARDVGGDKALTLPLDGERHCDVAIVGGGYTGLWSAIHLKKRNPAADVVLIEKEFCGYGGSSRNSGYILNLWAKFPTMRRLFGRDRAIATGKAIDGAIDEVVGFCEDNGIDVQFRRSGWLWGATHKGAVGEWNPIIEELAQHQITPYREIGGEEIADRWGMTGIHAGAFDGHCGHLQPARLVAGLRKAAIELGVTIHENTPMTALGRTRPPTVTTPNGTITAERVVIALYAWAARLPELRRYPFAKAFSAIFAQ